MADARMEILACCVLLSGGDAALAKQILSCTVTEEALQILWENAQMPNVMEVLMGRIEKHLLHRLAGQAKIGVIVFSNIYGVLGKTRDAEELLEIVRGE